MDPRREGAVTVVMQPHQKDTITFALPDGKSSLMLAGAARLSAKGSLILWSFTMVQYVPDDVVESHVTGLRMTPDLDPGAVTNAEVVLGIQPRATPGVRCF